MLKTNFVETKQEDVPLYIQRNSQDWYSLIQNLKLSKSKSNRDVLCAECWEMLNYETCRVHKALKPAHCQSFITSRDYSSEDKFISLSLRFSKVYYS